MKPTRPSSSCVRVAGLPTSCRSAPKRERLASRELVRKRLVEHFASRPCAFASSSISRSSTSIVWSYTSRWW